MKTVCFGFVVELFGEDYKLGVRGGVVREDLTRYAE